MVIGESLEKSGPLPSIGSHSFLQGHFAHFDLKIGEEGKESQNVKNGITAFIGGEKCSRISYLLLANF